MPSERNGKRLLWTRRCGEKTLLVRRGNYSCRRVMPFIQCGPFGTWLASWSWGEVEWSQTRWL